MPRLPLLALAVFALTLVSGCQQAAEDRTSNQPPPPRREFRAAWVATVANIDWPTRPGLPVEEQKAEARRILDHLVSLRMNAVIFQVRPHADALYESKLEPWSSYLSGQQGVPPSPYYDPLEFWCEEAHRRGLELHAWFNPYRANHPSNRGGLADDAFVKRHPELCAKLGDKGYWWMDPASKEVQEHSLAVMMDVARRYAVDGIHIDDYFYPYASYNDGRDFPDQERYDRYLAAGGALDKKSWRRAAVDRFIAELYRRLRRLDRPVKFGISPFGIWRPGHPRDIQGLDQYDVLYADARRWLREGWLDYFTPQLYWPVSRIPQSFPVLLGWWAQENVQGRHLWPGLSLGRSWKHAPDELFNQIQITRGIVPEAPGTCFFSMKTLLKEEELSARLMKESYRHPALVPPSPWLDDDAPSAPKLKIAEGGASLRFISPEDKDETALWVLYERKGTSWRHRILPGGQRGIERKLVADAEELQLSRVDRCGNESRRSRLVPRSAAAQP